MEKFPIKYGSSVFELDLDTDRFDIISSPQDSHAMDDRSIGAAFDNPIGSLAPDEIVAEGETVLIAVPDATRETGAGQIVNLLVRRLIAGGTPPYNVAIIFSTGIHRKVTEEEKRSIVTPFIAQRVKMLDHDPRDLMRIVRFGETSDSIPVELSRAITEYDHLFLVGGISFHYFAGFTGGRKLICPGLASAATVSATHKLAFDTETKTRRIGVGPGILSGNAVHHSFIEAAKYAKPSFSVNTIVNDQGEIIEVFCGDWLDSHRSACEEYLKRNSLDLSKKRNLVIASCGGSPFDVDLIQAHKSLDAAASACEPDGTIVLFAECGDGLGRKGLQNWFDLGSADAIADRLCSAYEVSGQTAWAFRKKTEMYDVRMVTSLDDELLSTIGVKRISLTEIKKMSGSGYVIPAASKLLIKTEAI